MELFLTILSDQQLAETMFKAAFSTENIESGNAGKHQ